jgi:hypothetical protein
MKERINPRTFVLATMILSAGIIRLISAADTISPLANLTPLGAMAMFGGTYYRDAWKAFLVPLLTLWLTDMILNRLIFFHEWVIFYDGFAWVYVSFAVMVLIGRWMERVTVLHFLKSAFGAALLHWIVTDFGVWLGRGIDITTGLPLSKDLSGLWQCYYQAIPYFMNLFIGNVLYGAMLYGAFEWMKKRYPVLEHQFV